MGSLREKRAQRRLKKILRFTHKSVYQAPTLEPVIIDTEIKGEAPLDLMSQPLDPMCGHPGEVGLCTSAGKHRGPRGGPATQALVWLIRGGTPSSEWSVILSGTEKFNDYKGEFNYMLSLTSSGYDGTITHVIYQQDTCIHNKPKAKH